MKELTTEKACLALGYFDSVHLGHRALIEEAKRYAEQSGAVCAVATFVNNAYKLFNFEEKQVYTFAERSLILSSLCDCVLPMRFDSRLKSRSAEDFLDTLTSRHNICAFVCGYDYLFGAGAKGDADFLKKYCLDHGNIDCIIMPKYELDGERVSTTRVKDLLRRGDIEKANAFLGEPFSVSGKVIHGRGAGRMFDIPTANIKVSASKLLPKSGVYGVICEIDGNKYYGATNIGGRPTFGLNKLAVETMLADFNDDIYDREVTLRFIKRLRDVKEFEMPAQLSKQIHSDIKWYEGR